MLRILIYGIVIYLMYKLLRKLSPSLFGREEKEQDGFEKDGDTDLIKDPQCGTYFMKQRGVKAHIGGNTVYFCSEACRNTFLSKQQRR